MPQARSTGSHAEFSSWNDTNTGTMLLGAWSSWGAGRAVPIVNIASSPESAQVDTVFSGLKEQVKRPDDLGPQDVR